METNMNTKSEPSLHSVNEEIIEYSEEFITFINPSDYKAEVLNP